VPHGGKPETVHMSGRIFVRDGGFSPGQPAKLHRNRQDHQNGGPSATPTAASTASPAIASTSINPRAASPSTFSGADLAQPGDYYEVMKHGLAGLIS